MQRSLQDDVISTAESFAANFADRGNFDFGVESLRLLDDLLDEIRDFVTDDDPLDSVCSMAGCYIFEVARRNYGGKYYWAAEKEQPVLVTGEPAFSVSIFAFDKVRGRIVNGSEDNIPFYFDGYVDAVEEGKKTGYCATIV